MWIGIGLTTVDIETACNEGCTVVLVCCLLSSETGSCGHLCPLTVFSFLTL